MQNIITMEDKYKLIKAVLLKEKYGINLDCSHIECEFSELNVQCIKRR